MKDREKSEKYLATELEQLKKDYSLLKELFDKLKEEKSKSGESCVESGIRTHDKTEVREPVKRLDCHNPIIEIIHGSDLSFNMAIDKIAEIISENWSGNYIAGVSITLNGKVFETKGTNHNRKTITYPIQAGEKVFGTIEITGPAESVSGDDMLITAGESEILASIARLISWFADKHEKEIALQESERNYMEAQKLAKLGHWDLNLKTNRLTWSEETYRIFGLKPYESDVSLDIFMDMVHPEDRKMVENAYIDSLNNKTDYDIDHRLLLRNGEMKYVNEKCRNEFDEEGNVIRSIGTCLDISNNKKHELEFIRQNERLNAILQSIQDTIFIHDKDGACIDYYRTADTKTFLPEELIIGSRLEDIFSETDAKLFLRKMREAIETGSLVKHMFEIVIKGEKYNYEAMISPIGVENVLVLSRDITEHLLIEKELKESIRTRDKMFSIISHDLRGPVSSLIPMVELILGGNLNEVIKYDILEGLKKTAIAVFNLLENLLNWAKIQTKTLTIEKTDLNLNVLLNECVELTEPFAALKSIHLDVVAENNLIVLADRNAITLVIRNLLDNAIKFTPIGGIITVKARQSDIDVEVEVADNGIGIDNELIDKLLSPNFLKSSDAIDTEKGSGLGLVLCREFIEKNGGRIYIESKPGEGSRFIFTLRKSDFSEGLKPVSEDNQIVESEKLKGMKILIVEDDQFSQIYGKTLINRWNARAEIACNGKEAIELIRRNDYDFIMMDIKMPVMDGFETIKTIRRELKLKTPVIVISAYVTDAIIKKAFAAGFDDYIVKPIDPQLLYSKIVRFIKPESTIHPGIDDKALYADKVTARLTDHDKLGKLFDGDRALANEMIRKFLDVAPVYYNDIITGYNNKDLAVMRESSHKLKPSLLLLANNDLTARFKLIYDYTINNENFEKLSPLVEDFTNWFPQLCNELRIELTRMK